MNLKAIFLGTIVIAFVVAVYALMVLWFQSRAYRPLTPVDFAYPAARPFTYPDDWSGHTPAFETDDTPVQIVAYYRDKLEQMGWWFERCGTHWYREERGDHWTPHNVFLQTRVLASGETMFSIWQSDGGKIAFSCRG